MPAEPVAIAERGQAARTRPEPIHAETARAPNRHHVRAVCLMASAALLGLTVLGLARYPLSPWILAGILAAYAGLLWLWPFIWLLVLPVVLPAFDLGLWTGWMMTGEADFFVLTTLAVLLARNPPRAIDLWPAGLPRLVLLTLAASWLIAACIGLLSPLGAAHSDNAFLRPDNALRLAKGLVEAMLLLPFLRQRQRTHGDAVTLFGCGMAGGVVAVTLVVLAERALFADIMHLSAGYRVAGPFSSMRVGGGHIGAYIVMALPFAPSLVRLRPRWLALALLLLTCLAGGYTLTVTFARTAYAAGLIGMAVTGALWVGTFRHRRRRLRLVAVLPVTLLLAAFAATACSDAMLRRLAASALDFETRQANWRAGLTVRDTGALAAIFGAGLGSYQRTMLMRSAVNRPSDVVVERDGQGDYLSMRVETPFYLGQKIVLPPPGVLHLSLFARTRDEGTTLGVAACDKVLLYSDNCRGGQVTLNTRDGWRKLTFAIPDQGLGGGFGWLRRPVELSLFGGPAGHHVDLRTVSLTDEAERALLVNGDFAHGLDRWIFTDDSHISWRMLNEYLMLWFETGAFGLTAWLTFSLVALAGGVMAARTGDASGASVAGSLSGFMISGLFDNVLEAPRLATLFFLVCLCGLIQYEAARRPGPTTFSPNRGS
jgi:hypothetical protein